MRKILHVLESPILHGKPYNDPPVHVIWDTHEYSSWALPANGNLVILQYTGQIVHMPNGRPPMHVEEPVCVLRQDVYLKVWEEIAPPPEPQNGIVPEYVKVASEYDEPSNGGVSQDLVIERAQPGHDGFSDDVVSVISEDDVVRPEAQLIEEPEDQKTTIVVDLKERDIDLSKYGIGNPSAYQVIEAGRVSLGLDVVPPPRKLLDWDTLSMPLVPPPENSFFDGSPQTQTETSKES